MKRFETTITVNDQSEVSAARRAVSEQATALRLSETAAGRAAIVATELATNLVKHGRGGSILVGSDDTPAILILSIDKGPGIASVAAAMRDGFSTAGSPGTGLGAISRLATSFDLYSVDGRGTALLCTISEAPPHQPLFTAPRHQIAVGGICIAKHGEYESGDAWTVTSARESVTIGVADGLGHGAAAATASTAAVRVFNERAGLGPERLLEEAHGALRPTRGAAVGIASIDAASGRLDFAGVGNIAGTIVSDDGARRVVSLNGIVGHEMRKVQMFSYPWSASSVLVMQSDGVSASWNPAHYPGLMQHDPALIAAIIFRDHCRGSDDATVVVAKVV